MAKIVVEYFSGFYGSGTLHVDEDGEDSWLKIGIYDWENVVRQIGGKMYERYGQGYSHFFISKKQLNTIKTFIENVDNKKI